MKAKFAHNQEYTELKKHITINQNHSYTWFSLAFPLVYAMFYGLALQSESNFMFVMYYSFMGIVLVFIFLFIIHEAVHHTFFRSKKGNQYVLYLFDFIGANSYIFKKRHLISHHSFCNVEGLDTDIEQSGQIKMFPSKHTTAFQSYQHIFIFFLYPLYVLNWMLKRDFMDFFSSKSIIRKFQPTIPFIEYVKLIAFKSFYLIYMIIIPIYFFDKSILLVLFSFICFTLIASIVALFILLPPHVHSESSFPKPNEIQNHSWMEHQVKTTSNVVFSYDWLSIAFARFNYHLAHHLFPNAKWHELKDISEQMDMYFSRKNIKTRSYSLYQAMKSHYQLIKNNAKNEDILEEIL